MKIERNHREYPSACTREPLDMPMCRCRRCGTFQHPETARSRCRLCDAAAGQLVEIGDRGRVWSFTHAADTSRSPECVLAVIELRREKIRMIGKVTGFNSPGEIHVGMEVVRLPADAQSTQPFESSWAPCRA
jgi:uncharacterized OB-fold protein